MNEARIIIVDDEPLTCATYAKVLAADGHKIRTASDVFACRAALRAEAADIVVLDVGLPGVDGLTFAAELVEEGDMGVIIVTNRADMVTRIAALNGGADDYLVKPVHPGELSARVRSLLRRRTRVRGLSYRVGRWIVNLDQRSIHGDDGKAVITTRGEFNLLASLVEAKGKIVSRESLSESVSRSEQSDVRSVDALVSRLRRKLTESNQEVSVIVTAPGFGYRLGVTAEPL